MSNLKKVIRLNLKSYTMGIALIALVIVFQIATNGTMLTPLNVTNLILQNTYVFILGMGMLLCILTGGNIDLSVGSLVAFTGAICGVMMVDFGLSTGAALAVCLFFGILVGCWNGFWIAIVKIHPWIVTLSGMLMFRGLALVVLNGRSLGPFPPAFQYIATGFFRDIVPGSKMHVLTILIGILGTAVYILATIFTYRKNVKMGLPNPGRISLVFRAVLVLLLVNLFCYLLARHNGISFIMVVVAVLVAIFSFITRKSVFGRHLYAIGGNIKAARLSGINTQRVMFVVYTINALMAVVAGIVVTARLNSATPKAGQNYEMDAIAACFLGGVSISGGSGTVFGVLVGALIMGVLNNGMSLLGVSIDWQSTVKGLVVLIAVAFDMVTQNKAVQ